MKRNNILIIVFIFLLIMTLNIKCFADANDFNNRTVEEKQNRVVYIGNEYYEKFKNQTSNTWLKYDIGYKLDDYKKVPSLNSTIFIYNVYSEASFETVLVADKNSLSFYSTRKWLVSGILPKGEEELLYVYNRVQNYREQKEKELININLLLSGLKKGDIIIFASKDSKNEEVMLYIGDYEALFWDEKKGIQKVNLYYYLGFASKQNSNAYKGLKRGDYDLPLVAVARPLAYGGYVLPYIAEQKFYSKLFYKAYKYSSLHMASSSYFNQSTDQDIEYDDNTNILLNKNKLYSRFYKFFNSSNSIFYKVFKILKNISSMILLSIAIIFGIKYMLEVSAERKGQLKKGLIWFFIGAVIIFAADRIALLIINIFIK